MPKLSIPKEVDDLLGKMTLEQKVGGCLVMDFMGTVINPYVSRIIRDFQVAGLRVETGARGKPSYAAENVSANVKEQLLRADRAPRGECKDFSMIIGAPRCTPAEYVETVNKLRDIATDRPLGIPIHLTLDQENNGNENYTLGNVLLFPCAMGLACSGDADLIYRVARAQARQLRSAGFNWIHSPVLDVNTNHRNFEIATRAYSDNPEKVAQYAAAALRGFTEEGIIATGKHFPGRGASDSDAHLGLPSIELGKDEMFARHLMPYQELISAGLPAIMTAHTLYSAFDKDMPATLSKPILTDLLRGELGFDGVVTTDNMLMGGIVSRYGVAEGCVRALLAGADLLLVRSENPLCEEVFTTLLREARAKRIPESRLDEANRRVLTLKHAFGLFENGGKVSPELADLPLRDQMLRELSQEAAARATVVRNRAGVLPLHKSRSVLLIEQVHATHTLINSGQCHPSIFWRAMLEKSGMVGSVEVTDFGDQNRARIERRIPEADTIVMTNWVSRRSNKDSAEYIRTLARFGKPVVVVTNSPFEFGSPADLDTVVNVFSANPESLRAAARIIYGEASGQGALPLS